MASLPPECDHGGEPRRPSDPGQKKALGRELERRSR
jgi:hypothetical protein